jgi:hypothetical protein
MEASYARSGMYGSGIGQLHVPRFAGCQARAPGKVIVKK